MVRRRAHAGHHRGASRILGDGAVVGPVARGLKTRSVLPARDDCKSAGRLASPAGCWRSALSSRTASFLAVRPSTLGVIGLGAIGGSVARSAKQAGIATVLGWSPNAAERDAARSQGAIDETPAGPV